MMMMTIMMMLDSKKLILLLVTVTAVAAATTTSAPAGRSVNVDSQDNVPSAPLPSTGAAVDEVVVESSLYIKPKPARPPGSVRRNKRNLMAEANEADSRLTANDLLNAFVEHKRVKRQRFGNNYGQSQAASNAAANNNFHNPLNGGFGSSAANAQAQAFNAQGPAGSFGASSAGTVTQALNANRFGVQNSAGASHTQTFTLPNGQTINFAGTNSFANGGGNTAANSRGGAVSVSQG